MSSPTLVLSSWKQEQICLILKSELYPNDLGLGGKKGHSSWHWGWWHTPLILGPRSREVSVSWGQPVYTVTRLSEPKKTLSQKRELSGYFLHCFKKVRNINTTGILSPSSVWFLRQFPTNATAHKTDQTEPGLATLVGCRVRLIYSQKTKSAHSLDCKIPMTEWKRHQLPGHLRNSVMISNGFSGKVKCKDKKMRKDQFLFIER